MAATTKKSVQNALSEAFPQQPLPPIPQQLNGNQSHAAALPRPEGIAASPVEVSCGLSFVGAATSPRGPRQLVPFLAAFYVDASPFILSCPPHRLIAK